MKKTGLLLLCIVLLLSSNFVFGDSVVDEVTAGEESFFEEENAKGIVMNDQIETIYVGIGGMVEINVEENPTTGFIWHMAVDYPEMIEFEVDEFTSPNLERDSDEQIVGASGMHTYIFNAKKQGMVKITLDYYRDWEPEIVADSRVYMINIVPDGEKAVYINSFNAIEGNETNQSEALLLSESDEVLSGVSLIEESTNEKELNIFQKILQWFVNLFK